MDSFYGCSHSAFHCLYIQWKTRKTFNPKFVLQSHIGECLKPEVGDRLVYLAKNVLKKTASRHLMSCTSACLQCQGKFVYNKSIKLNAIPLIISLSFEVFGKEIVNRVLCEKIRDSIFAHIAQPFVKWSFKAPIIYLKISCNELEEYSEPRKDGQPQIWRSDTSSQPVVEKLTLWRTLIDSPFICIMKRKCRNKELCWNK